MRLGMRMGLNSRQLGGSRLDPAAKLYIAAVEAALGATIESALPSATNPKKIISDFYKAEKDAGRYALHKRIYLPIYNNLAANAVDAITRDSGSFVNTPTTAMGYVQGNGTNQYFDFNVSPAGMALTPSSGGFGWLSPGGGSGVGLVNVGCENSSFQSVIGQYINTTGTRMVYNQSSDAGVLQPGAAAVTQNHGVLSMQRHSGQRNIRRRVSSGVSSLASNVSADAGTVPTVTMTAMACKRESSLFGYSNVRYGAWWVNAGWSNTDDDEFTLNLKTLWENLTGLTLP